MSTFRSTKKICNSFDPILLNIFKQQMSLKSTVSAYIKISIKKLLEQLSLPLPITDHMIDSIVWEFGSSDKAVASLTKYIRQHLSFHTLSLLLSHIRLNLSRDPNKSYCKICDSEIENYTKSHFQSILNYLNDDECILFRNAGNELRLSKKLLIHLIHSCGGIDSTLKHLQGFNAANRSFLKIDDIISALHELNINNSYLDDMTINEFIIFFASYPQLIGNPNDIDIYIKNNLSAINEILIICKSIDNSLDSLRSLANQSKQYNNISLLINELKLIEQAITNYNSSDLDYVVQLLQNLHIFTHNNDHNKELIITKKLVKELVYKGRGIKSLENHLKLFERGNRTFETMNDLIIAITLAERNSCHLSNDARYELAKYLTQQTWAKFDAIDSLGKNLLHGPLCDQLMLCCNGIQPEAMIRKLSLKFNDNHKDFYNFEELINEMKRIETNRKNKIHGYDGYECRRCHAPMKKITKDEIELFMNYFNSDQCQLFSNVDGELRLTRANLDHICHSAGDFDKTIALLKHLDAEGRKFNDFDQLVEFNQNVYRVIFQKGFKLTGWKRQLIDKMLEIGRQRQANTLKLK